MNCEDVELELAGGEPPVDARVHLADCASCQATAKVLGLAALPALSDTERMMLNGLAVSTQQAWKKQQQRGGALRQWGSLALAAGLGALIASAVLVKIAPKPAVEPLVRTVVMTGPEVPVLDFDEANLSDDEVFFDVSWPSPTEGDL